MVRLYRTLYIYIVIGDTRCARCNMHRFGEVQAHQTSSNLLDTHPHKDSKVYRLLSHEFRVVRLYRTSSNYISSGDTRCAGCNMHRFGEAHRTFSNYILTEIKIYIEFLYMSSGWFDCTEPPRPATVENPDLDTRPPPVGSHLTLLT